MLNISNNRVSEFIDRKKYPVLDQVERKQSGKVLRRMIYISMATLLIAFFLPWTQNITSTGQVTTLTPEQRPQTLQSQIPGRIEEWFVKEGDFVKKGDTILRISEIKSEYFDDRLTERTNEQILAKSTSETAYKEKVNAFCSTLLGLLLQCYLRSSSSCSPRMQTGTGVPIWDLPNA